VTRLLAAHAGDHQGALAALTPMVYDDLRRIAHRKLANLGSNHTLQTTGLVHEAFLRFHESKDVAVHDRSHFFALSARMMRFILLDHAKQRRAQKRGGPHSAVELDDDIMASGGDPEERIEGLVALDAALQTLAQRSARQAKVVEYRFFGGMSVEETAEALDTSPALRIVHPRREAPVTRQSALHRLAPSSGIE
jgi:RNA polymerase sigma factor (TIGR02999 family)